MANVFKNYTGEATTGGATVYTIPASTTGILMGLNLANKTGSQVTSSVQMGSTYIVKDAPIPAGSALGVLDGKLIAEAGEAITVTASANTAVDVIISVLEQS
jgi:hypothetical protein